MWSEIALAILLVISVGLFLFICYAIPRSIIMGIKEERRKRREQNG